MEHATSVTDVTKDTSNISKSLEIKNDITEYIR